MLPSPVNLPPLVPVFALVFALMSNATPAREYRLAVASSFLPVALELSRHFEARTGHRALVSAGATGALCAQILSGAPFEILLAADHQRPALLQRRGHVDSRRPYAWGVLALWIPGSTIGHRKQFSLEALADPTKVLAMPNPRLAPLGVAARNLLQQLHPTGIRAKVVLGNNAAQAFQFVAQGQADLGLVGLGQLLAWEADPASYLLIPGELSPPFRQEAVLLTDAGDAAREFYDFLHDTEARAIIAASGYRTLSP